MSKNLTQKKKGFPTPKRKKQEAARIRPLVPKDRKEAILLNKKIKIENRKKIRAGIENGEERYLSDRDKGDQKRFTRKFVDTRFNICEFMMPVASLITLSSIIFAQNIKISKIFLLILWIFILSAIIDIIFLIKSLQKRIKQKFGLHEKGISLYAVSRALQMKFLRIPKVEK